MQLSQPLTRLDGASRLERSGNPDFRGQVYTDRHREYLKT